MQQQPNPTQTPQPQQQPTTLPQPKPLPPPLSRLKITYGDINIGNINQLSMLNHISLPVKYSTGFYSEIITKYKKFSRFVYYNDIIIGSYTVRTEPFQKKHMAYILTFIVLEKYRKLKIGSDMITEMARTLIEDQPTPVESEKEKEKPKEKGKGKGKDKEKEKEKTKEELEQEENRKIRSQKVEGIYLHVHVKNESAINFYKRQGFVEHQRLENYYTSIDEPHALVLVKMFE